MPKTVLLVSKTVVVAVGCYALLMTPACTASLAIDARIDSAIRVQENVLGTLLNASASSPKAEASD